MTINRLPLVVARIRASTATFRSFGDSNKPVISKSVRAILPSTAWFNAPIGSSLASFNSLVRDMDSLWQQLPRDAQQQRMLAWHPSADMKETAEGFSIHAELPGVKKEHIELELQDRMLTIQGKKSTETKDEQHGNWVSRERSFGSFTRHFALPEGVDATLIKAKFADGVLDVSIVKPKAHMPSKAPAKISIA
jgi:HSP20 family protein